ncbi:MAG: hypothetical protein OEW08_07545, partial [Gammaproteobacteria bacterium]|nr:hypothetical protein [Gammaproteobacteria bacterium]
VTASDGLGNTTARSIVVNRDRQAPIISTTPASLPLYTNATSQSFAASATDALSAPTISVGLNTVAQATSVANGLTANWSGTSLVLSEGTNVITVDAVDLAGNKASQTKFSVVRDTVLPTLSMSSSFNSNGSSSYSVTGTVTELNPDIVTLTKTNTSQSGTKFTKTYVGGSKWSVTVTGLVSGSNTFSVVARDKAGNVSTTKSITVTR